MSVPIIDLFAGPGGLGEGFAACVDQRGNARYRIALSIEKEKSAHRTLELRSFFRQFPRGSAPEEYYLYVRGQIPRTDLFSKHRDAAIRAQQEAWNAELGSSSHPDELIDRTIRSALGRERNHWVLIGGPPCQAYSLVGRARIIGASGRKVYESDHRHFLYKEYLRILAVHRPAAFVMENVKGMLSASVDSSGVFERIVADLQEPLRAKPPRTSAPRGDLSYTLFPVTSSTGDLLGRRAPTDFVVRCERLGLPQARHRVIIVGVRSDICGGLAVLEPAVPSTVHEAIGDLPRIRSGLSKEVDSAEVWVEAIRAVRHYGWWKRASAPADLKACMEAALDALSSRASKGSEYLPRPSQPRFHPEWLVDNRLGGVCNHSARSHIRRDLHRYLFASAFAKLYNKSPHLRDFPKEFLPDHENVDEAVKGGKFGDRFRVQLGSRPSTTITSHISKDGHYFIHYRPEQCRSLTVREAARLQTFPDNYFFEGTRTEQYHQVGNAVPPLLAVRIADALADVVK